MRRSTIVIDVALMALLSTGVAVIGQSSDALMANFLGTWKINLAKSKFNPGPPPKSFIAKHEPWENGLFKHTTDTVTAQGRAFHAETIAKFDGKDYPRQGVEPPTTAAYKRIDDRTLEVIVKAGGNAVTNRWVFSRDGKTITLTGTGKDAQGQAINNVTVWEKQ